MGLGSSNQLGPTLARRTEQIEPAATVENDAMIGTWIHIMIITLPVIVLVAGLAVLTLRQILTVPVYREVRRSGQAREVKGRMGR